MDKIGVILECNPFHNGHKYFLSQIDKKEDDIVIAIISTSITQRGEISVLNKKVKTKLLLENNVDIVIALPSIYANQGGNYFAYHALRYLNYFKINKLYFGSESADLKLLKQSLNTTNKHDFKKGIHKNLEKLKANDILGISYIKALEELGMTDVDIKLIKRINNDYNDSELSGEISSASSIRKNYLIEDVQNSLPAYSYSNLLKINEQLFYQIFLNNLEFASDYEIFLSEDNQLLNKFKKIKADNLNDFIDQAKDKNNSQHKIRRVMTNVVLLIRTSKINQEINYIQVLGFNERASHILTGERITYSLKNINTYDALSELQASKLQQLLSGVVNNDDFNKVIITGENI